MKLSSLLSVPILAINAVSAAKLVGQSEKPLLTTNTHVPGQSPLVYCETTNLNDNILKIEYVNISPNPPLPGKELAIEAAGYVKETIEPGAYIKIEVKYGYIKLISQQLDFCQNAGQVNMTCPIKSGDLHLTKLVQLPKTIPPGKYHVTADVYNANDSPITCLSADVVFTPGSKLLLDL